jgi:DNA excision repair protein ERCC-2
MYPKILAFAPVIAASLPMSVDRPCILPLIVGRGSTARGGAEPATLSTRFEARDDAAVLASYGDLLVNFAATVPDGVVAFFPSYAYMEQAVSSWHKEGTLRKIEAHKLLFMETKDIVETTLSLTSFRRACDVGRGAVFFSIARGKVAEGIDFDRHYGRAVLIFGIPYQYALSVVLRARMAYLRDTFHIRENDFLTFDAVRQAAQCCGRIIRSKRDYGVIVLADDRYARADKRLKLPVWIQQFLARSNCHHGQDFAYCADVSHGFDRSKRQR